MSKKQIFQTDSKNRWYTFKWLSRTLLLLAIVVVICVIYTLQLSQYPKFPTIDYASSSSNNRKKPEQLKKSKSFKDFKIVKAKLLKIKRDKALRLLKHPDNNKRINAAFYVNWSKATQEISLRDLEENISHLDMVITESFFLNKDGSDVTMNIDTAAMNIIKKNNKMAIAVVSNVYQQAWNPKSVANLLNNVKLQQTFIQNLLEKVKEYGFKGINIDFEELNLPNNAKLVAFQKNIYEQFHAQNLLVTQDISPDNEDYKPEDLQKYNDYIFLMAYDQHSEDSNAGDISHQVWVEEKLDELCSKVSADKVILCLACYGYDWPKNSVGKSLTYIEAITQAHKYGSKVNYNSLSANLNYSYVDENKVPHQVFFTDAITNYNLIRKADDWDIAGIALWRLGAEDDRLWQFISKNLSINEIKKTGFEVDKLEVITLKSNKIDYIGNGEILDLIATPSLGKATLKLDKTSYNIVEQKYISLPTKYIIKRFGEADKKIVLTFDDGPDAIYTPQILEILKREKVPACFFIVGVMGEKNMSTLQQEYNEGFEIGNHTFFHPDMSKVGPERVKFELNATRRLIESVTGHSTVLFRAPFNADAEPQNTAEVLPVAQSRKENYINIGEFIDPEDWLPNITADQIYDRVVKQHLNGNIILLHDAGGNREATVEALPRIIKYFKQQGFTFVTVGDLMGKTRDEIMPAVNPNANGELISWGNMLFINIIFYGNMILYFIFTIAIVLALLRTFFIAYLAIRSKRDSDKEAKKRIQNPTEKVSIIIPAYNERVTILTTINSLLGIDYPNFELIFVDDGSTDDTYELVKNEFGNEPRLKIYTKPNGGKAEALNFGIAQATSEYVVCIDADTQLKTDAVTALMRCFYSTEVAAVAGTVKVGNVNNILTKWQSIEYITAQNMDRRAFEVLNSITVVPGAIGAFRRSVVLEVGSFTTDTLAEDCDLTMRILKAGYIVKNCDTAVAYTEAPENINMLLKQRFRWSFGVIQSFWKNKNTLFNKKYGYFGMIGMPNILIYQIILPLFSPLADLFMLLSIIGSLFSLASINTLSLSGISELMTLNHGLGQVLFYYLIFIIVDLIFAAIAFKMEKEKYKNLLYLIPQRFFWRQLMYLVLFKALRKALKGEFEGWGVLKRTGNVKTES